ncbi:serine--tRNA ligase, mitochondrial isoform X1 [Eleutherodactylus coqui]|uniref:serine--tRNA ligase, mitochondrial isoform X1 n=1 Tax=Eleutherodactylus coqui TaxID=57060 RepID=UPI0034617E53
MAARMLLRLCVRSICRGLSGTRALCTGESAPPSRLYECMREGNLSWSQLDMEALSRDIDAAERELSERRPGRPQEGELRALVSLWGELQALRQEIHSLEEEKSQVANEVKELTLTHDQQVLQSIPRYLKLRTRGKEIRHRVTPLYQQETELEKAFYIRAFKLPNRTHPDTPIGDESHARVLEVVGEKPDFDFNVLGHLEIGEELDIIRQRRLAHISGNRCYYLRGAGAMLQHALVNFTITKLVKKGFLALSVPDMLRGAVFEGCGMQPTAHSSQVYSLDPSAHPDLHLAGTSEVGIAGYFMDHVVQLSDLPIRTVCCSTCYRAETDNVRETWGLYRVHHFTKVEMFGVTANETGKESQEMLQEFMDLQKEIFSDLGLHFHVLEMPSEELGLPAYRKCDLEAWMPGRGTYGEISSASNCTDFQSRRLSIMYQRPDGELRHAHTINGTACAVPRLIIAILESNQLKDGRVRIPEVLQPFMGADVIEKPPYTPQKYIGPNQKKKPTTKP